MRFMHIPVNADPVTVEAEPDTYPQLKRLVGGLLDGVGLPDAIEDYRALYIAEKALEHHSRGDEVLRDIDDIRTEAQEAIMDMLLKATETAY